jgi:Outer membrane efflux protein
VKSILLLRTKAEGAQNAASEISATLLWQEWQTIGKARLLFIDIIEGERAEKFIVQSRKFLQVRFDLTSTAISQGNATLATLSPDLVAVGDIQKTSDDLERLQLSRRHQLNALLGLDPGVKLALVATADVPRIDPATIRRQLSTLADRRPDLIALQYGYRSEDARVREAILSQFPNLSVGVNSTGVGATGNTLSFGPQLTVDLPIFNRNQGGIAVEQATREQLNREFNSRISAATGEIGALLSEQALLSRQLAGLEPRLKEARTIAEKTETAFKEGTRSTSAPTLISRLRGSPASWRRSDCDKPSSKARPDWQRLPAPVCRSSQSSRSRRRPIRSASSARWPNESLPAHLADVFSAVTGFSSRRG